jgi:CheY-like chemotaxis protein
MTRKAKRILIVEDHKDSSLWISMVLRQCGYVTTEAADGAMGIQLARKELPQLILLDIHLPAGSGYFVLESLRKFEETRHIPVIIMTGDWELSHTEMRNLGAAALFRKPMDVQAFVSTIGQVLENYEAIAQMSLPA